MPKSALAIGLWLGFVASFCIAEVNSSSNIFRGLSDQVDFGRADHGKALKIKGKVFKETVTDEIGVSHSQSTVLTFQKMGDELSLNFKCDGSPSSSYMLEVEEIHRRRLQVFGYTVLVNGKAVYFRSYEEMGAGPNRYFILIPKTAVPSQGPMEVTFRNEGRSSFSLSRVWLYANFFELASDEGVYKPMTMYGEALTFAGPHKPYASEMMKSFGSEADKKAWEKLNTSLENTGYDTGIFLNMQYALLSWDETTLSLKQYLDRAIGMGVQFQLAFNSGEWGSHPSGPDGLGGYFSDGKYSSIKYDPVSKSYRPTWLSTPGHTTWPAWNDPQLHLYLEHRLKKIVQYYKDRRDFLKAKGLTVPYPLINQDWGLGANQDCGNSNLEAARRDGVEFVPEDGLNETEKMWMYRTMSRVPERFGRWFSEGIGRDSILIQNGEMQLPTQQSFDDYYFQTYADAHNSPFKDDRWAGWQFAVGPHTWVTGEFLPHLPATYFDYIRALGKLACPNLERMALPTLEYVQTCYERGHRSLWICNANPGDAEKFAPQARGQDALPAKAPELVDWKILDLLYGKTGKLGEAQQVAEVQQMIFKPAVVNPANGGAVDELQIESGKSSGSIVYCLENDGQPFAGELELALVARISGGNIEVSVGTNLNNLTPVTRLSESDFTKTSHYPWKKSVKLSLGRGLEKASTAYIRITLNSGKTSQSLGIEHLRVSLNWPKENSRLVGETLTVRQQRILNLWTQDRAVFERMELMYLRECGKDEAYDSAMKQAMNGKYASAYKELSGALSLALPARFALRGHGQLGSYPLAIQLQEQQQTLLVDLLKSDAQGCEFSVRTEIDQTFEISVGKGEDFALKSLGNNHWKLEKKGALQGDVTKWTAKLEAKTQDYSPKSLPAKLAGTMLGYKNNGLEINTQEAGLWLDNPIFVAFGANTIFKRMSAGAKDPLPMKGRPQKWDKVDIVMDSRGVASEVISTYGQTKGIIKSFSPPSYKGNLSEGIVELEDGSRYEFSNQWQFTELKIPGLNWMVRFHKAEELAKALPKGMEVEILFTPYTTGDRLPRMVKLIDPKKAKPNPVAPK